MKRPAPARHDREEGRVEGSPALAVASAEREQLEDLVAELLVAALEGEQREAL